MALSLVGSANLIRPGLRPNGSSHRAFRHRHLGKGRVPGKRLRSNRWVGWVEKDSAGLGG
jgi:hypothetical protein